MTDRRKAAINKLYYEALSKIPKRFIDEETACAEFQDHIIIVNPKFAPMIYRFNDRRWKRLTLLNPVIA